jgi:hypothetical protein
VDVARIWSKEACAERSLKDSDGRPETFSTGCSWFRFLLFFASVIVVLVGVQAKAAQVTLAWDEGTDTNVVGHRVYYGTASRNYDVSVDTGNVTTYAVTGLSEGLTYYFAVTAYDISYHESAYSNEVANGTRVDSGNRISTYIDTVQKLYIGYYQRPADPQGLLYWVNALATIDRNHDGNFVGEDILPVLAQLAHSAEARALYGGDITSSNIAAVVDGIYLGLFGRPADPGGLAFYVNELSAGRETAATVPWSIMNGAQGADSLAVLNRLIAANRFTQIVDSDLNGLPPFQATYAGDADCAKARQWLVGVTWDSATVPTWEETTAYIKSSIADPGDPILNR